MLDRLLDLPRESAWGTFHAKHIFATFEPAGADGQEALASVVHLRQFGFVLGGDDFGEHHSTDGFGVADNEFEAIRGAFYFLQSRQEASLELVLLLFLLLGLGTFLFRGQDA